MKKLREIFKNQVIVDSLIIMLIVIVTSILCSHHFWGLFTDRGREFLFPQEILNGKIPYKDITMIYFPFAYYINALIYKIFGVNINSLIITQTFCCSILMAGFYNIARDFLSRRTSFLVTLMVIFSCIFNTHLFNFILPYSYSRLYGTMGYWVCIFSLVKLLKTKNNKFAYLAGLAAGFTACCKLEFLTVFGFLVVGLLIHERMRVKDYLKIFLCSTIFPFITISLLYIQGVKISEVIEAFKFSIEFSKSDVMVKYLGFTGMYPYDFVYRLKNMVRYLKELVMIAVMCFWGLKLYDKYKKFYILPVVAIFIWYFLYNSSIRYYWLSLPIILAVFLIYNFKKILNFDKMFLVLMFGALLLAQREFFYLSMDVYGRFSLPLLALCLVIVMAKYFPKEIVNVKTESTLSFVLMILIGMYSYDLGMQVKKTNRPLRTNKGTFYVTSGTKKVMTKLIRYIEDETSKDATVLVLPEGNFINFVTDRKVDLHCFMMDRLYYEAYKPTKAISLLEQANSDYIIIVKGFDIFNFQKRYLYEDKTTMLYEYILKNYDEVEEYIINSGEARIFKAKRIFKAEE